MSETLKFVYEPCGTCYKRLYRGYSSDEELLIAIMIMPVHISSVEEYSNTEVVACSIIYADEDHELVRYLIEVIMNDYRELEIDYLAVEGYVFKEFPCLSILGFSLESRGNVKNPFAIVKLTED